jgi:hypothetical protein
MNVLIAENGNLGTKSKKPGTHIEGRKQTSEYTHIQRHYSNTNNTHVQPTPFQKYSLLEGDIND